ncbi:MAG: oxygen-dependent coproporphyrinogen oxidase [Rhodobacteraceae bacterium]|nr:oxygen-dependent coproporphyrinogen oxidase [Paracoccaceae bacterium]
MSDDTDGMQTAKRRASAWFHALRDEIVAEFEGLEQSHRSGPFSERAAGRFEIRKTRRAAGAGADAGGGVMSIMRGGRVFEKVGVNVSTVFGTLSPQARAAMAEKKRLETIDSPQAARFWASGISLVAHMRNPHCPAVHMNTRMFWTPSGWWFGGGADLNPCREYREDTAHFHAVLKAFCDRHGSAHYPRMKAWAESYFYIPHRGRTRGVGGIFLDDYSTGDWAADFALIRDMGRALLPAFVPLIECRRTQDFANSDREAQLIYRGLYAEYNLIYDRGTRFGLASGHDADAVLMSLPPLAKWV